jgi:hypothetical protein
MQQRTDDNGWSSGLGVGRGACNPSTQKKNKFVTKVIKEPRTWTKSLDKRPKRWNSDMRFGLWGDVDWIGLAQDRDRWRTLVNSVLNLWVPYNSGKLSSILTTGDLSSSAQLHGVSI